MKFVIRVIVDALAIALATWLVEGIRLTGKTQQDQIITLVLVAVIFGLVNAIIAPIVKLLSLPFIILTLGLLLFVINALMLWLTSAISEAFGLGFHVDGFLPAVIGAVIVMVATWVLEVVLPDGR